ncbi:MAG: hypothetical protein C4584_02480 [Armatimonadetes bacterium]|nr:MAG: hypothetical protein C4584_02480 [Armatimonadota bacterium]
MKKLLLLITFYFALNLSFTTKIKAAELSIGVYPPVLQIQATPPAAIKANITLQNLNENPQDLKFSLNPFTAKDDNGQIAFIPQESLGDLDQLLTEKVQIRLDQSKLKEKDKATPIESGPLDSIHLDPYESKDITLNINIDKNDPLGDYYFSIIFMAEKENETIQNKSFVKNPAGIGNLVLLSVGQKGTTKGNIETFKTPLFLNEGPVPFTLLLNNTSGHLIQPTGTIHITNIFGKTVGKIDVLPSYILSNSSRYLTDINQASPSASTLAYLEKHKPEHKILIWNEKFLMGFYTAKLKLSLSGQGPQFTTTTHFFALPTSFLIGLAFVLIIVINIYLKVYRKTRKE